MKHRLSMAWMTIVVVGCAGQEHDPMSAAERGDTTPAAAANDSSPSSDEASRSDDTAAPAKRDPSDVTVISPVEGKAANEFVPPAVPDGFMRLEATPVTGIEAGADVTFCEYLMPPVDHDMNILAVQGGQSAFGHHVVAFSYTDDGAEELNKTFNCGGTEFTSGDGTESQSSGGHNMHQGGFLGSSGASLPSGVAYRIKKGDGIMLNVHFINSSDNTIDGKAYLDVKLAEVDPNQKLASLFTGINAGFNIDAHAEASSSVDCVVKSDLQMLMMSNHMHEFGTSAKTEVLRADSDKVEVLREDDTWSAEMQFNPNFNKWSVDEPFIVHAGDTLRTSCNWMNTTDAGLRFPREMCVSAGFVLTTGDQPTAPGSCTNGKWTSH